MLSLSYTPDSKAPSDWAQWDNLVKATAYHYSVEKNIADIYGLAGQREALIRQGIIGKEKNTDKLLEAIEKSKQNEPQRLLTGFGISGIGKAAARELMLHFGSLDKLAAASIEEILQVRDMGSISAENIAAYFADPQNKALLEAFRAAGVNLVLQDTGIVDEVFGGKSFVITGTLPTLGRKEAAAFVEAHGGRVSGSVSKKTDYVVAGEAAGSKLTKAQELGITVLSEQELLEMAGESQKE